MSTGFDAIVIGAGPGGEAAASRLLAGGLRVALIERELIGGECAYWACIPSKTLLRPVEARAEASNVAGLSTPDLDWAGLRDYRDWMIRHLDDTAQVADYQKQGATRPPIAGLDQVPVWTNREATILREIPPRAVMIGGSAVGVELGQFLARARRRPPTQRRHRHPRRPPDPGAPARTATTPWLSSTTVPPSVPT